MTKFATNNFDLKRNLNFDVKKPQFNCGFQIYLRINRERRLRDRHLLRRPNHRHHLRHLQ